MSEASFPTDGASALDWTTVQQSLASDPGRSAWVSANAGSGKTHVLTQRVIRLLLAGSRPSAILCLTYTKAAASEMSNRVFSRLAEWARLDDASLAARIAQIEGREPDRIKLTEARRLFAKALETPGGLKIQTIHAFCEALLHQFPLEANVAGHFTVLDDRAAANLLGEAKRSLVTATAIESNDRLAKAFEQVLALGDEHGLEALLADIVSNRQALQAFLDMSAREGGFEPVLRGRFGLAASDTPGAVVEGLWPLAALDGATLTSFIDAARSKGGSTAGSIADDFERAVREADPFRRLEWLKSALLTKKNEAKSPKSLMTKGMLDVAPLLLDKLMSAQTELLDCLDRLSRIRMFEATSAALIMAEHLIGDYEALKKTRSQLDFEDLIARTANLLNKSDAGPWIHFKLDQGIDHILVDEAQDTSPLQWSVIRSLRDDFFSGDGARAGMRTFFAVGDEKQSIYSFQGARPERFAEEGRLMEREVQRGGLDFSAVRLPLSFRSTSSVLSAVDQVFSIPGNARGLGADASGIVHMSNRLGHPGRVESWDMVFTERPVAEEDWTAPFDATPESAPPAVLARRMAGEIVRLIGKETIIHGDVERPIEPGDILVLVRKRDSFVNALTRELKGRANVPVAGADRLKLITHIAVQDLLALGRFALLPNDDLSLAALLKSPLLNLSEEELYAIAAFRAEGMSLWHAIEEQAQRPDETRWAAVAQQLSRMLEDARADSAYDFYANVLGLHGGRRRFLGRLGTEAADILDEFLAYCLEQETSGLPGLQPLIAELERESPEVKREQDHARNEVRIMTVHASKGLEAPVVFLVDGGSKSFNSAHLSKLRMAPIGDHGETPIWVPSKECENSLSSADKDRAEQLAGEEYRRLLYVGMTRAADRLIVCGYRGKQQNEDIWHTMVADALRGNSQFCREVKFSGAEGEWSGLVWELPVSGRTSSVQAPKERLDRAVSLPDALYRPLPPARRLPRPLSPSGAGNGTFIDENDDDLLVTSPLFGPSAPANLSLRKGRLVHKMLQVLPGFPAEDQEAACDRYLKRAAASWTEGDRRQARDQVLRILADPELASLFSAGSQPEVAIMGTFSLDGEERVVSGRLDRLAVDGDRVMLADYKTNRVPPRNLKDIPFSHVVQMAIYREILRPLYPERTIECLLIYTEDTQVFVLPEDALAQALARLKAL